MNKFGSFFGHKKTLTKIFPFQSYLLLFSNDGAGTGRILEFYDNNDKLVVEKGTIAIIR